MDHNLPRQIRPLEVPATPPEWIAPGRAGIIEYHLSLFVLMSSIHHVATDVPTIEAARLPQETEYQLTQLLRSLHYSEYRITEILEPLESMRLGHVAMSLSHLPLVQKYHGVTRKRELINIRYTNSWLQAITEAMTFRQRSENIGNALWEVAASCLLVWTVTISHSGAAAKTKSMLDELSTLFSDRSAQSALVVDVSLSMAAVLSRRIAAKKWPHSSIQSEHVAFIWSIVTELWQAATATESLSEEHKGEGGEVLTVLREIRSQVMLVLISGLRMHAYHVQRSISAGINETHLPCLVVNVIRNALNTRRETFYELSHELSTSAPILSSSAEQSSRHEEQSPEQFSRVVPVPTLDLGILTLPTKVPSSTRTSERHWWPEVGGLAGSTSREYDGAVTVRAPRLRQRCCLEGGNCLSGGNVVLHEVVRGLYIESLCEATSTYDNLVVSYLIKHVA